MSRTLRGVEIAGPGFINLRLDPTAWQAELRTISDIADAYGRSDAGKGVRVNVEYVSTNPTGPMHMGHCRGAVVGDALATLLEYVGHEVTREYYINDAGGQVDVLARSVYLRYREALGEDIGEVPEGLYPGAYLVPVGHKLATHYGSKFVGVPESEWLGLFRKAAVDDMMAMIRADLALLGVHHDKFSSEAELQAAKKPEIAEQWLRAHDLVYDGVLEAPKARRRKIGSRSLLPLFRSTKFGDDQDRPIKKSDGSWTYFGADMAYHFQKAQSADQMIDIWGADHAGTVKRITAAVAALTEARFASTSSSCRWCGCCATAKPVKMSKRSGNFVTLADVVEEVGKDVVRFTMLTRKADAQMDFDFAKVVEASKDNPVFYVQYAHARIASAQASCSGDLSGRPARARSRPAWRGRTGAGKEPSPTSRALSKARRWPANRTALPSISTIWQPPSTAGGIRSDQPDRRVVIVDGPEQTAARLFLSARVGQVIGNGLALMGVAALEEMN